MRRVLLLISGAMLALGCGPPPDQSNASFIALARDFQGFESWEKIELTAQSGDNPHVATDRTVFVNGRPAAGATEWPKGTIIVKKMQFDTFAMVKRGEGYNANGAHGWEWFDLATATDGSLVIRWRGLGPPAGEKYSSADQTCNSCHGANTANDSVMTPGLMLPH